MAVRGSLIGQCVVAVRRTVSAMHGGSQKFSQWAMCGTVSGGSQKFSQWAICGGSQRTMCSSQTYNQWTMCGGSQKFSQ